jgi:hypothetical protein
MRLELAVPDRFPNGAARALSLIAGGKSFFIDLLGPAAQQSEKSLEESARLAGAVVTRAKSERRPLDLADLQQLDNAWQRLVNDVACASGIDAAKRINGGVSPVR